jgi:acyl carrier protein
MKPEHCMNDQEVFDLLTPIFRSVMADQTIVLTPSTTTADIPKWDSFRYIDIILRIEESTNIKIRSREANKLRNVGEMVALIQAKQTAS